MASHTEKYLETPTPEKTQIEPGIELKDEDLARMATSGEKSIQIGEVSIEDTFQPLQNVEDYDGRAILTVRALATGVFLGSIIGCANVYLGKTSPIPQPSLVQRN